MMLHLLQTMIKEIKATKAARVKVKTVTMDLIQVMMVDRMQLIPVMEKQLLYRAARLFVLQQIVWLTTSMTMDDAK
jgi:hypothetical protein